MKTFLDLSKTALAKLESYNAIRVILGNETCDLDSAVCTLAQGFHEYLETKDRDEINVPVIPVMNITEKEMRVKTEVIYYFKRHDIPQDLLTFRDQVDLSDLAGKCKLKLTLVDHHALADEDRTLADSVVQVIDHRPQDASWPWHGKTIHLQTVGSCATHVARNFILKHPEALDAWLADFLRGPILLDTCNFSKEANRATPTDHETIEVLEGIVTVRSTRNEVFNEILKAKTDISELTPDDLIIKDLKMTRGVPIAGFSILVKDFLTMDGAYLAIEKFGRTENFNLIVLLGMNLENECLKRDIAIFSTSNNVFENMMIEALTGSSEPFLNLTLVERARKEGSSLTLYKQGNVRATRKQILPIVRDVASENFQ